MRAQDSEKIDAVAGAAFRVLHCAACSDSCYSRLSSGKETPAMENRLGFGVFLAPHHPIGEHPTLQLKRDLELVTLLDDLGFDEFWVGEHHSGGWETIASPEMFLAAAAMKT